MPLKRRQETVINGGTRIWPCLGQGIKVFIAQEEMLGLVSVLKIFGLGKSGVVELLPYKPEAESHRQRHKSKQKNSLKEHEHTFICYLKGISRL